MTKVQYRLAALSALATAALALAACNSEPNSRTGGPTADAAPVATNSKVTLEAYSKDRSTALALAVPPLQN